MKCPNCNFECKTPFCGMCKAEMPVPELEEILKILLRNAVHNSTNAVERQRAVVAKQDGKPVDPKLVAKVEAAVKLCEYWQRLADAQAKAIEELKPKMPETRRGLTREELDAANKTTGPTDER